MQKRLSAVVLITLLIAFGTGAEAVQYQAVALTGLTSAYGINDAGQIVGSNGQDACLWDNGTVTDLGNLGGSTTVACAINDKGEVVGYGTTPNGDTHAFLWQNAAMTDLGSLGGSYSAACGINNAGQVAGTSRDANGNSMPSSGRVE